ncbi:DUF4114 domain-containing protein [Myxococcus llanfairpwllgwyngyllgogerychwyrndrobwllllantysiliogogogochensis]|uniref:DUF4114 domain-containing protein n=1 Tax=Myxococcus llanfairpwllgwyngyllgogerychwyrndrobwllllantysiliogogogochensis TaxID=2590453 RepID=A0A540WZ22_9BACT|nr:DUF4114 domain-containing protein [Myxococcus llanfairpwllgwyngyllgogerychwyrndrobwllllantysiliogogogochensis]TQF14251.1 DUF4114 domain-containing protein [Myxococcus llanfairpwllgwyngyllgogerychwyrndrobwllllantysiliogogogochensis]
MHTLIQSLAVLLVLATSSALAQQATNLCESHLDQDRQAGFKGPGSGYGSMSGGTNPNKDPILIRNPGTTNAYLQLNTNQVELNAEQIAFPFDQRVTISYVFESAGASHALGYLYLDDAINEGYVNAAGDLLDANANGILDLHEALFNVQSTDSADKYVGPRTGGGNPDRRCTTTFTDLSGKTYYEPEIAMRADCLATYAHLTGANRIADARPGQTGNLMTTEAVGRLHGNGNAAADDYSDKGLFPRIPNLLEPKDVANGGEGIGQMVFLLADDDNGLTTYGNLAPVTDIEPNGDDGVPDYDVSRYDNRGVVRGTNPDPGLTTNDRTVDLGEIKGGRELVFFLVVYYSSGHSPGPNGNGTVFPCLKQDANGKCLLHLRSPISVFFSKAAWNLDQNGEDNNVVAARNIGCPYEAGCNRDNPDGDPDDACSVAGATPPQRLCGWLDGPKTQVGTSLHRLRTEATYNFLDMPMERVVVTRPSGTTRNPMPHVIVGAPSTDRYRWILGFEDIPGGGDRDFNDVVFVINKVNGGVVNSGDMSGGNTTDGDISPQFAEDFLITRVRFTREDDVLPAPPRSSPSCRTVGTSCWTEKSANACSRPNSPPPTIQYSIAVDCNICTSGANATCTPNLTPQWIPVQFDTPTQRTKELDMLELGFTGSQLCWKVNITSPNEDCVPVINNVNVGYQAVRAGSYSRSSPSTVGNAIVWGVNETPGKAWGKNWPGDGLPEAAVRAYDGRKDFSVRGRLYFRSLYDPEVPTVTKVVQRWDAGRVMAMSFRGSDNPLNRTLITMASNGDRTTISDQLDDDASTSPLFPDSLCDVYANGRYVYDLNFDDKCGTPSITLPLSKRITDETNDRNFLREWIYGWEDRHGPGPSNVKRPWAMGGINLSTVAIAVPPYLDTWFQNARASERDDYRRNFMERLKNRPTLAYVGTMNGFLHAFESGEFRNSAEDECADGFQLRGYFNPTGAACVDPVTPRNYGSGEEKFAYLPRLLLNRYINNYVQHVSLANPPRPQMDASPTIANVDFGIPGQPAWTPRTIESKTEGAKTVLVSASGRNSPAVFALDITNPDATYFPTPLWEFNLADSTILNFFTNAANNNAAVQLPDGTGSRHAPSVARLSWGSGTEGVWTAIVGTDYNPSASRAGALYLLNMKTGQPLNFGNGASGQYAGVITLDDGSGVAAESALVDLNRDGNYDVIYVPTTAGNVYRINLEDISTARRAGRKVETCKVASASVAATDDTSANNPANTAHFQQIYSNIAVRVVRDAAEPVVRFYFGTADNPDEYGDGPANKAGYRYHLMAFEDTDPDGSEACELLEPLWMEPLDPGQAVWGGVSLSGDKVYATTAVGASADLCNLSETDSGKFYQASQVPDANGEVGLAGTSLEGHGVSAPVVHDQHLFVLTATGQMKMVGDDKWNNGAANPGATRSRILVYDPIPDGRLPR